jgi:hypothetical protein
MIVVGTADRIDFAAACPCCGTDATWTATRRVRLVEGYSYSLVDYQIPCPSEQLREAA